eukprot:91381-Rhodomonas_salina.1
MRLRASERTLRLLPWTPSFFGSEWNTTKTSARAACGLLHVMAVCVIVMTHDKDFRFRAPWVTDGDRAQENSGYVLVHRKERKSEQDCGRGDPSSRKEQEQEQEQEDEAQGGAGGEEKEVVTNRDEAGGGRKQSSSSSACPRAN